MPEGTTAESASDNDGFVVWSDDIYGDVDDNGLPSVPVSRIPDSATLDFLVDALRAPAFQLGSPYALVNLLRPCGEEVFREMPASGQGSLLEHSIPINVLAQNPKYHPKWGDNRSIAYLLLHCKEENAAEFWGEFPDGTMSSVSTWVLALTPQQVPRLDGGVVLAGCCWGALITDTAAVVSPAGSLRTRTPDVSIALTVLARGAVAFVGSTGLSLSPVASNADNDPTTGDDYYAKPLHAAFWRHCTAGSPPALALMKAKCDYLRGIPHRGAKELGSDLQIAQEFKELRQMTCLGIGW